MDIGMEPMDGLECSKKLREWESKRKEPFVPLVIIAQTANAHAESKEVNKQYIYFINKTNFNCRCAW